MKRPNFNNVRFLNWWRIISSRLLFLLIFLAAFLTASAARSVPVPFHEARFDSPTDHPDIIAKVLAVKISTLHPTKEMPIRFANGVTLHYKTQVIFSNSINIKAGETVEVIGKRTTGGYAVFGGIGMSVGSSVINWRDPIMRPGTVFVADVVPTKATGVFAFGNTRVLPIGLPVPSPVSGADLKPIEEGLRAWGEATRSGFVFYPYANVLPKNQTARLMQSHNFYLWALGVSSYCGGADKSAIRSLVNQFFYRPKPVTISLPDSQAYKSDVWQGPQLSIRKAAWLLYAMSLFPNPWDRPTAQTIASLMTQVAYRQSTSMTWQVHWSSETPWAYTIGGRCVFSLEATPPGYAASHTASIANFLKNYEIGRKTVGKPTATVPVNREK
jgi:hypothetical protein